MKDESWVTLAVDDISGWQALVLARSLKRTLTTRKLTLLATDDISTPVKYLLRQEYDLIANIGSIDLELHSKSLGIPKFACWGLKLWEKCVYISPNSLVLQNSDDLFNYDELSAVVNKNTNKPYTSLFTFVPNLSTLDKIAEQSAKLGTKKDDELLLAHFTDFSSSQKKHFPNKYWISASEVNVKDKTLPHIVYFEGRHWRPDIGRQFSDLSQYWLKIFTQDILGNLHTIKKPSIEDGINHCLRVANLPPRNGPHKTFPDLGLTFLQNAIAVVGYSCRFPGANNAEEYWNLLKEGKDPIRQYPPDRPNLGTRIDSNFKAGFLKCPVDEFDAKFFGISPREAPFVDPQQRILLEVIWESLENSNINPQNLKETNTGVFMGVWQQDYDRMLPDEGLTANDFHHRYLGNAFSATASRISYFLGLNGPNLAVESGCSSSLGALHLACESLRKGESKIAISSGVNLVLNASNPLTGNEKDAVVLSNDYHCKTFDESADGFVRAEGCGALVLKRYTDAIRDRDHICALVRGSAMNNDGAGSSFGTPNAKAQERVIREALQDGKVSPWEISYVEAHGTGTVVGDPTEMYSIGQVYSEGRQEPLLVSSVKTNIGHAEAAAGIAGVLKVILCIENQALPPHLHLKNLNPRINLESIPAIIPTKITEWKNPNRIAGVSSFSMSGTNVHMIIQEPINDVNVEVPRVHKTSPQVITISAKSEEALNALVQKYIQLLETNPKTNLEDLAYTMNVCRAKLSNRIAVVVKDIPQLLLKLEKKSYTVGKVSPQQKPKVAFLFTGQGSQYFGMAKNLYESFKPFRIAFDSCSEIFEDMLGVTLYDVIWNNTKLLEKTIYCQPSIFCVQYSLVKLWEHFGIIPDYVLGHSVGEFAACVAAGVISLHHGMKLVVERSRLVDKLPPGSMLAFKCSHSKISEAIKKFLSQNKSLAVDIAAVNSDEEVVVSGKSETLNSFKIFSEQELGLKSQPISASHAFHSRDMDKVLEEFGVIAQSIEYSEQKCTYVSGTLAETMSSENFGPEYWQRHLRNTVMYADALKLVWNDAKVLVEIGAQPILLGLAMGNLTDSNVGAFCPSLRKSEEDWFTFLTTLGKLYCAGVDVDWKNWFSYAVRKVKLPLYPFQRQKFWFSTDESENGNHSMKLNTPLVHPLLGRQMPAPLKDTIFCNTLKTTEIHWLVDHKVAEKVILPAAAYLESIIAAGKYVLQGSSLQVPLVVENFTVESALEIEKPIYTQTLVTQEQNHEDGVQYNIGIHRQVALDQPDKWKRHASGSFRPIAPLAETGGCIKDLSILKAGLVPRDSVDKAYAAIAEIGIQFGQKFQSIKCAWSGQKELLTQIILPEDSESYICHPIVLDGMIQSYAFRFALSSDTPVKDLQLPIGIRRFTWFARQLTPDVYAYTHWDIEGTVVLYNNLGEEVAMIEGLELIQTTVDSFLRLLRSNSTEMPDFWSEVWRQKEHSLANRAELSSLVISNTGPKFTESLQHMEDLEKKDWIAYKKINRMVYLYLLRSIRECDWDFSSTTNLPKLQTNLPKEIQETKFLNGVLEILDREGYICLSSGNVLKEIPTIDVLSKEIKLLKEEAIEIIGEIDPVLCFAQRIGQCLTSVLQGKMTPLRLLFPEDASEYGAQRFYGEGKWYQTNGQLLISMITDSLLQVSRSGKIRILEVGGGTGASTKQLIDTLKTLNISYDYTFTDISPVLTNEAKKKLGEDVSGYKVLNIENEPFEQGFGPDYDIIVAMQVLHATTDLVESLKNLRKLLRPGGLIFISEQYVSMDMFQISFGLLPGWSKYNDFRVENGYTPMVNAKVWTKCLGEAGFDDVVPIENLEGTSGIIGAKCGNNIPYNFTTTGSWIVIDDGSVISKSIMDKLKIYGREVITVQYGDASEYTKNGDAHVINPTMLAGFKKLFDNHLNVKIEGVLYVWTQNSSNEDVVKSQDRLFGLLHLCQALLPFVGSNRHGKTKLCCVTRGLHYLNDAKDEGPDAGTAWGLLKSFSNESPEVPTFLIDTDSNETKPLAPELDILFSHLWTHGKEMFVAIRDGKKYVQRLISFDKSKMLISLPASPRYSFVNPASSTFSDIDYAPTVKKEVTGRNLEIAVHATGLNFRDLFVVLKPEGFTFPKDQPVEVGLDISGIVTSVGPDVTFHKVGDEVFGFTLYGGLCSHVIVPEHSVMKKPKNMTFDGASTLPCAFSTAFYSLDVCAKMTSEDRVLIHVASGGVGLAAVQMCQAVGAEIYATAGSKRKRAYLRSLGIKYIYHSRNINYGKEIERDTNGKGVTIVINSLTAPGFKEATLDACAKGAKFIEIGKLNIWSEEDVKELRPDVEYFIVDLAGMGFRTPEECSDLLKRMEAHFQEGLYTALPHTTFPLDLSRQAFYFFQEAKHIGKVVIRMPKPCLTNDGRISYAQNYFNEQSTYLITGGLGGLGMEVTKWMTTVGGKNIVLVGRSLPKPRAQDLISSLNSTGNNIKVIHADISDYDQCKRLLEIINELNLPPLRGIFHAAGQISDGIIPNQNLTKFNDTFKPKVYGGWNLHQLTLRYELEFFVMFSSVAAIAGMPGQSNHCSANRYLDCLAHYRNAKGLPGTTLNFGAWSDVGAAAHIKLGQEGALGFRAFTPKQGIRAVQEVMRQQYNQAVILDVSDWSVVKQFIKLGNYLDEIKTEDSKSSGSTEEYDKLIEEVKKASPEDRQEKIEKFLEVIIKQTLRMPENEKIDKDQNFTELGVDSLMAMEMRNRLQGMLDGKTLTVSALQENRTLRSLSTHLANLMNSDFEPTLTLNELVIKDSQLPTDIVVADKQPIKPSEFKDILLTGATGHLGIYILSELTKLGITAHCLVRGIAPEIAKEKLNTTIQKYELKSSINMKYVKVVNGDISQDKLGMNTMDYDLLSDKIDSVIHCAVKNNHMDGYVDGGVQSMRNQNTTGMVNIIKFSSHKRIKPILYASSLLAINKVNENGILSEEFPDDNGEGIINGYCLSKFITEKLAAQALERGIPITVLRYPSILGHSETGFMPTENNHALSLLISCIQLRQFPHFGNGFPVIPVDVTAKLTLDLFLNDASEIGMYNLTMSTEVNEEVAKEIALEYGIKSPFVTYSEWRQLILKNSNVSMELATLSAIYGEGDGEAPKYISFHPLANSVDYIVFGKLSPKVLKNLPKVVSQVPHSKAILLQHLRKYFADKRSQIDNID